MDFTASEMASENAVATASTTSFVRRRSQQAGAQDVVDFVGAEFDRRDALGLAARLLLEVADRPLDHGGDLLGRALVAAGEVRDDDAEALQLERRRQQVRQRVGRDVGQGAAADRLGHAVAEIGRQLVEQDQGRLVADQRDPVLLVRRLRRALVEFDEFVGLPELLRDVAPKVLVARDGAPGDRDDARLRRRESLDDFLRDEVRERRVCRRGSRGPALSASCRRPSPA